MISDLSRFRTHVVFQAMVIAGAGLGFCGAAQAVEDTPEPSVLTVVRHPAATEAVTTLPLSPGTLSVVRATTVTADLAVGEDEIQHEEQETEIVPYASLPNAVRAFAERYLGGKGDYRAAKSSDQGAAMYRVSAIKDGLAVELILTEEGELAFSTREVPFSKLPAAVQASLRQRNPDGKYTSIQAVTANVYTATMRGDGGEEVELRIEPSGAIENEDGTAVLADDVE